MTRISFEQLIWDDYNTEHFKKHGLTVEEVKEALLHLLAHRKGKRGKFILIGRSGTKLISLIMASEEDKKYYIVTARIADRKERRIVYEKEK